MSAIHGSKNIPSSATASTPDLAERRRYKRINHQKQTRRDLRDARDQLRDCALLLSVRRPAAA